jgi:heme exporter protein D
MTDADLYRLWYVWLAIGGAIVVVAAALLVTIWITARGIEQEARRALAAVERIRESTRPIWLLDETNRVAEGLAVTARELERHGGKIAAALGGADPVERTRT